MINVAGIAAANVLKKYVIKNNLVCCLANIYFIDLLFDKLSGDLILEFEFGCFG